MKYIDESIKIRPFFEDFFVGKHNFDQLKINPTSSNDNLYYFSHIEYGGLVKRFVLDDKPRVQYICQVSLIKKGEKFTPRLLFSVRGKSDNKIASLPIEDGDISGRSVKANINLGECHEKFWKLVSFLQSLSEIDIPVESFSLTHKEEREIVDALRGRDSGSILNIIRQLLSGGMKLSRADISQLLRRREKLLEFEVALKVHYTNEGWWQAFFEENKWIFGYGLDYRILRQEQHQPHYGGVRIDGVGGQKGDYMVSTLGDINFVVLVEIKTPSTLLLHGREEIRNGAWSLSRELTDAISQISANIASWELRGSMLPDNTDKLEGNDIYTVSPKGIIVIGSLAEVIDSRSKRETFQRFRSSIHGIDIVTFDELYERAKYIVESEEVEVV